jgi:coenzyme F420-reducing hydrogenase delta subunit/ferredoxin
MSDMTGKEMRIVGFLCNWCSYGGADTAGVARLTQPTDLRIIRIPCSGRANPLLILKALMNGADGVLVSGCHPRDCHYSEGNYYARRRLETLKEFLPIIGIDTRRFEYVWVSASEGQRWQKVVTAFTEQIHALGKAKKWEDVTPKYDLPTAKIKPVRQIGCGDNPALEELKKQIKAALPDLHCVLGWQKGYDPLNATPLIMKTEADVDKLIWGPLNVHNLATFLPQYKGKKVGIVAKGCDAKGIVELLQEDLIKREEVVIFGMGCNGTVNVREVLRLVGEDKVITEVKGQASDLVVTADGKAVTLPMQEIAQNKCRVCVFPNATTYDHFAGSPTAVPSGAVCETPAVMAMLDAMSLEARMSFWKGHIERCIRCYACRNACPMCVCRDYCVADSREPHWISQEDSPSQKLFFQFIHALHLAGRCTGCSECGRACPMGIPIYALKLQVGRVIRKLFDNYEPGMDPQAKPPLLGFELVEKNIAERHIGGA